MGNQQPTKLSIDLLCAQIIIAKSEGQFSSSQTQIKDTLVRVKKDLSLEIVKDTIINELKTGMKGMPSIIYCLMWNKDSKEREEDANEVQLEALKVISKLVRIDDYFIALLFEHEIISTINNLAMDQEPKIRHILIKILSFLTSKEDFIDKLRIYNPLYTLNSLLASMSLKIEIKNGN